MSKLDIYHGSHSNPAKQVCLIKIITYVFLIQHGQSNAENKSIYSKSERRETNMC